MPATTFDIKVTVDVRPADRYPYRAVCTCGWMSARGYVAAHAAQIMADDHEAYHAARPFNVTATDAMPISIEVDGFRAAVAR